MWIPVTLIAATLQILRTSRQHELRSVLSANAAGFAQYLCTLGVAWLAATARCVRSCAAPASRRP